MNSTALPPALPRNPRDLEHLKLLSVFHYVGAGLAFLGLGFLLLHYAFFQMMITQSATWENSKGSGPPPEEFFAIFKYFYLVGGVFMMAFLVMNLLAAKYLRARRNRMFCLIVAGVNCLHLPLGTTLGVFTIIVLCRDSVLHLYGDD